jgi:hypothetical protein
MKWFTMLSRSVQITEEAEIVVEAENAKQAERLAHDVYDEGFDKLEWEEAAGDGEFLGVMICEPYDRQEHGDKRLWRRNDQGKAEEVKE